MSTAHRARYKRATSPAVSAEIPEIAKEWSQPSCMPRAVEQARATRTTGKILLAAMVAMALRQPMLMDNWSPHTAVRVGEARLPGPGVDDPEADEWYSPDGHDQWQGAEEECTWDELHQQSGDRGHDSDSEAAEDDAYATLPSTPRSEKGGQALWQPPYEYGLSTQQLQHWQTVEKALDAAIRSAPPQAKAGEADIAEVQDLCCPLHSLPLGVATWPCKHFGGSAEGWTFGTKEGITGYHRDTPRSVPGTPGIAALLESPGADMNHQALSTTHTCGVRQPSKGKKKKRSTNSRKKIANLAGPLPPLATATNISCLAWKTGGVWAVDTCNTNCMNTAEQQVFPGSSADVTLLQETKVVEKEPSRGSAGQAATSWLERASTRGYAR